MKFCQVCHSPRMLSEPKPETPVTTYERPAQPMPFPYPTEQPVPFPYPTEPQPAEQMPFPYPSPQPAEPPAPAPAPMSAPPVSALEPPQPGTPVSAQMQRSEVTEMFPAANDAGRKLRIILIAANAACLVLNIVGIIFLLK